MQMVMSRCRKIDHQQHIDDAIDEEENGHEEQLNDNANVTLSKMLSNKLRGTGVSLVARGTTVQIRSQDVCMIIMENKQCPGSEELCVYVNVVPYLCT